MNFSLEHRTFFIVGFVIYIAILIVVGIFCSRKNKDGEDYLLAGRKLPFILLLGTISATLIGTGSSLGATANGFRSGWYGSLYGLGGALGMFVLAFMFCSERDYKFMTLSEEMQFRFGGSKKIRNVMGFFLFIAEIAWLGNHMNGGATYLSYVTGLEPITARLITMLAFGIYVFIGGYLAVVVTDNIQILLILSGFILILIRAVPIAGGWQTINDAYVAAGKPAAMSFYGLASVSAITAISLAYTVGISQVGTPGFRTRVYSAASNNAAKKAFFFSGVVLFLFSFIPAIVGMAGFAIATREGAQAVLDNPNYTFAYMATTILGPTLGLMFLIAGLSATMSSADSDAMAGITILLVDVYSTVTGKSIPKEKMVAYSRVCLVITLFVAFLATLFAQDIIGYISNVVGSLIPSIAMMMILGKYWKRVTWQGGMACIFCGTIFGLLYLFVSPFQKAVAGVFSGPAIPVSIVALAAGIITSLATPKVNVSEKEAMRLVIESRDRVKV
ncbi:MAG: sodium:solute symporter family protein [Spirochaetaceae bacterium]|jgi:SSS family solute:Na+ symporter|nr:sodium:solute symporter family protein [Spirochaetaceae bacterium]